MQSNSMIHIAIVTALAVAPVRGVADPIRVVNSIRSHGCGAWPAIDRPLRAHTQLGEAARRLARGDKLATATSKSGYRAKKSASIYIRTKKGESGVAQILAERFCETIIDSSLHEIGVFRHADEIWMVLATPFSPPTRVDAPEVGRRVLELINEARSERRRCGHRKLPAATPLNRAAALEHAALAHAQDMAARSYLGHKGSNGSSPADRATQAGYAWTAVAENVAGGQTTAEEVVNTWLASPGHCANLMSARYTETGVAYAVDPASEQGVYWVQIFGARE